MFIHKINTNSFYHDFDEFENKNIFIRKDLFSRFIKKKKNINLVLGGSTTQSAIIPDSLGGKWFSFTNAGQNIYHSFKFIDYYKDSVIIDTILIGIEPLDFPHSYVDNVNTTTAFHIFGKDSITELGSTYLRKLQMYKNKYYVSLLNVRKIMREKIKRNNTIENNNLALWAEGFTKQGYNYLLNPNMHNSTNFDTLIYQDKSNYSKYFNKVRNTPNMFYFDLFNSLTDSLGINVIYLSIPKSNHYLNGMKRLGNDKKMWNIIAGLKTRNIEFWDYQIFKTDTFSFNFYTDETHISILGSQIFSEIIKNKLYEFE